MEIKLACLTDDCIVSKCFLEVINERLPAWTQVTEERDQVPLPSGLSSAMLSAYTLTDSEVSWLLDVRMRTRLSWNKLVFI